MGFRFDAHPTEDTLEEYYFRRLSGPEEEALEEHLLLCESCQRALEQVEEYIRLMKAASRDVIAAPEPLYPDATASRISRIGAGMWTGARVHPYVAGGAGLAVILALLAVRSQTVPPAPASVTLAALRGGAAGAVMASAPAARPLELSLDVTDLTIDSPTVQLEIVDGSGRRVWSGSAQKPPRDPGSRISARVETALSSGLYWVRLSSEEGELLREFGLRLN